MTENNENFLADLLKSYPQYFDSLLANPNEYNIRIIYTRIDRKNNGKPEFTDHVFEQTPGQYFYPASTVKFPVALLALQKLNELNIDGLDKNTSMITEAGYSGQTAVFNDPTTPDGRPTIAHYIKKIFLVSDNDAFNRLYEFLGQEYINKTLHKMGYDDAEILHRLSISLSEDENRHTNPVRFFAVKGSKTQLIYEQPLQSSQWINAQRNDKRGLGYYTGDKLVNAPFDFSRKNRLSLSDLHTMLKTVIFPEAFNKNQRFDLTEEDYVFVRKHMSMYPSESKFPFYDTAEYFDKNVKFILWGAGKTKPASTIRIFNKVGDAYGFLTDVAYIVDFENNLEFMISASIHCNSDGIYNDDNYDYKTIGFPFLQHLGEVIYEHELKRERKNKADLSFLRFNYSE